ncbi:contractile injection system protein, VgrG/Pvc8 family [Marinicrinis lubricantis]|uniref:Contractile injection system protein, VgrG/Pvc8 family n=1 Tax=Marinicrinis lubricantis TaxID=2086470 RepID=A0ABW1IRU8_9BACL
MMSTSAIAYDNLVIEPFALTRLLELKLTQSMNEHTRLTFTGIVPEERKDSYVASAEAGTQIKVKQQGGGSSGAVLFSGIVQNIAVKAVRGIYYIEVEAVSHSISLDLQRKSRSFQNDSMTFASLLQQVIAAYPGGDASDEASGGAALGEFTMQYQETDWQFLMRIASRYRAGLFVFSAFDAPKLSVGAADDSAKFNLENYHYRIHKRMADYRVAVENGAAADENDYIDYEVETYDVFTLGSPVSFKGRTLYVRQAYSELVDGMAKHRYVLCSKNGLSCIKRYNDTLIGASVSGKVIGVSRDQVQVHMEIDGAQSASEARWFPYSSVYTAEGSSGWYCMPEMGDYVRIYFPSREEKDGIAISSVRQNSDEGETNKVGNPDIKYFRTASGKELMMSPSEITITGKDGEVYIRLSDDDGIQIFSKKKVQIMAKEDIMMESDKKIVISAKEEISVTCKESNMLLDGDTRIVGKELKTN